MSIKLITAHGKFWWGKILVNHTGKAIGNEKFVEQLQSVHMSKLIHFQCIYEYWQGKIWQIAHNLSNSAIFPYQVSCVQ